MVRISDLTILEMLKENSRRPFVEIAKVLGVSEAAVRKRVRRLEDKGVIKRYTVEVDYKKLGFEVHTLIGIDTKPEHYIPAIERLKKLREVKSLYTSSGDHMILLECWFKKSEELMEFLKKVKKIEGVTRVCPAVILEKVK